MPLPVTGVVVVGLLVVLVVVDVVDVVVVVVVTRATATVTVVAAELLPTRSRAWMLIDRLVAVPAKLGSAALDRSPIARTAA